MIIFFVFWHERRSSRSQVKGTYGGTLDLKSLFGLKRFTDRKPTDRTVKPLAKDRVQHSQVFSKGNWRGSALVRHPEAGPSASCVCETTGKNPPGL